MPLGPKQIARRFKAACLAAGIEGATSRGTPAWTWPKTSPGPRLSRNARGRCAAWRATARSPLRKIHRVGAPLSGGRFIGSGASCAGAFRPEVVLGGQFAELGGGGLKALESGPVAAHAQHQIRGAGRELPRLRGAPARCRWRGRRGRPLKRQSATSSTWPEVERMGPRSGAWRRIEDALQAPIPALAQASSGRSSALQCFGSRLQAGVLPAAGEAAGAPRGDESKDGEEYPPPPGS